MVNGKCIRQTEKELKLFYGQNVKSIYPLFQSISDPLLKYITHTTVLNLNFGFVW